MLEFGIGIGPTWFPSMDEISTCFLPAHGATESPSSMISCDRALTHSSTEPITTRFQQYLFNPQSPALPNDFLYHDTPNSISNLIDQHVISNMVVDASMESFANIDGSSSTPIFSTTPTAAVDSSASVLQFQPPHLIPFTAVRFSGATSSSMNIISDTHDLTSAPKYLMSCGASSIDSFSSAKPPRPVSTVTKRNVSCSSVSLVNSFGEIDMISTAAKVVSDISTVELMSDATLKPKSSIKIGRSSSHYLFGASSYSSTMPLSSTKSMFSSSVIPANTGAVPSKITAATIVLPAVSPELQQSATKIVESFVSHISIQGLESDRVRMGGLIKNAIPVRGVKMLRIRYELHCWWNEYKLHNPVPTLDVQKAFAFELLASQWFEDKLAAVLFMQEVLQANKNLGVHDLEAFGAAFAAGHVRVYKVCDHLSDKVLFNIVHCASALTEERKNAIEKLFEWTKARDMWQSRAALCTLSYFADNESLRDRILKAAMVIMRRPEKEAKSAAGAALRELSKFDMDKVLGVFREPDNIMATSAIALKKACTNLTDNMVKELKEWRKNVIAQRRRVIRKAQNLPGCGVYKDKMQALMMVQMGNKLENESSTE